MPRLKVARKRQDEPKAARAEVKVVEAKYQGHKAWQEASQEANSKKAWTLGPGKPKCLRA